MRTQVIRLISGLLALTSLFFSLGCLKGFEIARGISGGLSGPLRVGQVDPDCMNSAAYDACIFDKSPVAQGNQPLLSSTSLASLQTYGVTIRNLDSSGYLQNEHFAIHSAKHPRAKKLSGSWKYVYSAENVNAIAQVMTYYWLNQFYETFMRRYGIFHSKGKRVKVTLDDVIAGWSSAKKEIYLKSKDAGDSMALDASIVVNYMAHANLHFATQGKIADLGTSSQHRDCALAGAATQINGCCTGKIGCSRALANGVADYQLALLFEGKPGFGEMWSNDIYGVSHCGVSRNLDVSGELTADEAFSACSSEGSSGQIHVMGTVYATAWWNVRKSLPVAQRTRFDQLFLRHLERLTGQDNFDTAGRKAVALDKEGFGEDFSDALISAFGTKKWRD